MAEAMEIPDIPTFKTRLTNIMIGDTPISQQMIDLLVNRVSNGRAVFQDNEFSKYNFLDLTGIIFKLGEKKVIDLLRQNPNTPIEELILNTEVFEAERRRNFMEATKELKERQTFASIVRCPQCGSN